MAAAASSTQINLTWTASTDNVGVTGYLVERCQGVGCSNFAQMATPAATSFNDMGLTVSTSYSYRVRATDAAGNLSGYSNIATTTTQGDITPPTAPTNLMAAAASSTQINLSWTASTDNVGVTGYRVERCQSAGCSNFGQISTPAGTSFNDTGLTASTSYSYRVRATDAAGNLSGYSNIATTSTLGSTITVSISPKRGGLTTSQTQSFAAAVQNDVSNQGVTWNATGGTFITQTAMTALYKPPVTPGTFTITATSVADNTKSATATFGVTDLAGVFMHRYDVARTGQNRQEYALTPSTVSSSTFDKLFSCAVDGEVYAQPLYVGNFAIAGGTHNVVFVATEHDSVYAFDADANPCVQYWKTTFLSAGVTTVPPADTLETGDIQHEIGITGTPVIDPVSGTLFVVAKTKESGPSYHQRLHALDLTTGNEKLAGPAEISNAITIPGNGDTGDSTCPSSAGNVPFCPLRENQRPALLLLNGKVYIAWASHGDHQPYHGWVIGYSASDLSLAPVLFNTTPNGGLGGIWQSGNGPAADATGNIYVIVGNGTFDTTAQVPPVAPNNDFGDSFIKLSTASGLSVADFFTPANQSNLNAGDLDVGSGGPLVLPDSVGSATVPHLLVGGDKQGILYLVNRDSMGRFIPGGDTIVQEVIVKGGSCILCGIFSTPAFWEGSLYVVAIGDVLKAYPISNALISASLVVQATDVFDFPGATPAVSSQGATNGIAWVLNTTSNGTPNGSQTSGPAILFAYNATNLSKLFSSATSGAGAAGNAVKFTVPTVANGKVYVGTQTEITVYGLLPN